MKLSARAAANYILFAFLFTSVCMLLGRTAVRFAEDTAAAVSAASESPFSSSTPGTEEKTAAHQRGIYWKRI